MYPFPSHFLDRFTALSSKQRYSLLFPASVKHFIDYNKGASTYLNFSVQNGERFVLGNINAVYSYI